MRSPSRTDGPNPQMTSSRPSNDSARKRNRHYAANFRFASLVAKYMARRRRPPSQGWRTFLRSHADGIASIACGATDRLLSRISVLSDRIAITIHPDTLLEALAAMK